MLRMQLTKFIWWGFQSSVVPDLDMDNPPIHSKGAGTENEYAASVPLQLWHSFFSIQG